MMDAHDTNQPLNQGELEEEKKTVEVSEAITETPAEDVTAEVQPEAAPKPATKEDVLNQLKELAQDAETDITDCFGRLYSILGISQL